MGALTTALAGAACSDEGGSTRGDEGAAGSDGSAGGALATGPGGGAPTPRCEEPTEGDIEGPYYRTSAPWLEPDTEGRAVLSPDEPGERVLLTGRVVAIDCGPLANAELDLWQADAAGDYDLEGYTLRGRVRTSEDGRFAISTVVPGRYPNAGSFRPRHLHLKLRAAAHRELTTQLYFPGDPYNESDPYFDARLLVRESVKGGERVARFDFVLEPS